NWPGLVVFNPSPFPRTEVIDLPDGSVRVAHSVPSHGYSYLPDIGSEAGTAVEDPGAMIARGQHVTIRLDPETGAIASLFHRDRRTEWVRRDSEGLNAIEDSRLESFTRIRLDRVGVRLVAVRSVSGATMITTITVYDDLPWVDIVNTTDLSQDSNFPVAFSFALDNPTVAWETPLGAGSHATPIGAISHLRWSRSGAEHEWHVLFRGIDSPYIACNTSGRMVSLSSGKRERYRLQIHSPDPLADVPFEFGWGAEPMATAPVVRSSRSNRPTLLPRFGQLLRTSEGGINIFTVKPSDDGAGIVIYLQDTIGLSRDVPILGRLLAFDRAEILDIEENSVEEIPISEPAHVNVPVAAFGITAVRLTGAFDPGG
ncbi:MAG: hypothetical protein OEZ54_11465, partial [Gemmatimonadota bacterium]|nr:hypothetical protein [Gemmatimonadota bacterium]